MCSVNMENHFLLCTFILPVYSNKCKTFVYNENIAQRVILYELKGTIKAANKSVSPFSIVFVLRIPFSAKKYNKPQHSTYPEAMVPMHKYFLRFVKGKHSKQGPEKHCTFIHKCTHMHMHHSLVSRLALSRNGGHLGTGTDKSYSTGSDFRALELTE